MGAAVFSFTAPRRFSMGERAVLESVARQCAEALDRSRLYEAEQTARAEAERARAAAEIASQAKSQFLANMSHELRTPLNAIAGHVQLLEMGLHGPVTDAQRSTLQRVERAQEHLLGLINQLLNYAKLGTGTVEFDVQSTDLRALLDDVTPMIEPQMSAKRLSYEIRVPELDCHVLADADKLRQVVLNLLANATKFTPMGGHVEVELASRPATPDVVYLRVLDTGIGIPLEKQEVIFEPFVQVRDASTTWSMDGTGLGLSISRDLARGMGGDIRVRSKDGQGSAFTVTLRRAQPIMH